LEAHHLDLHIPALVNAVLTEKNLLLRDGTPLIAAPVLPRMGKVSVTQRCTRARRAPVEGGDGVPYQRR